MAEITPSTILSILPDPSQTLTPQVPFQPPSTNKKKFTCFADLTTEIRLEIYALLFPPYREIDITPQKTKRGKSCHCGPGRCLHPPITLFINRESRAETLRFYKSFVRDRIKGGKRVGGLVIYYRPKRDVLFSCLNKVKGDPLRGQHDWVASLKEHNDVGFLSELRTFEIRYWDWDENLREKVLRRQMRLLGDLTGLELLKLEFPRWYLWNVNLEEKEKEMEEAKKRIDEGMREYFEGLKVEGDGKRTVPKVELKRAEMMGSRWW